MRVAAPPPFTRQAPEAPEWLDGEARAEWDRITPGLEALDILKPEDRAALAAMCEAWSRFVAAVKVYRTEGLVLSNPGSGRKHAHPAVAVAGEASREFLRYAVEFGLTPSAENRLNTVAAGDDDGADPFNS